MASISFRNVVKAYGHGPKATPVIHGLNAEVADGARFLGHSLYAEVKYREAAEAFGEALHLRPEDTGLMLWLANSLHKIARFGEAEPLMRRALAIDDASFGPDHPDVARDLNNLAQLLQATNRLGEAEPLMRRALAIDDASFGPDHPNTQTVRRNLEQMTQSPVPSRRRSILERLRGLFGLI